MGHFGDCYYPTTTPHCIIAYVIATAVVMEIAIAAVAAVAVAVQRAKLFNSNANGEKTGETKRRFYLLSVTDDTSLNKKYNVRT